MMKLLKYIELPHMAVYKRRWVRRLMIPLTIPQEIVRAIYGVFWGAAFWWKQP
jgi:hypothetical protein